MKKTLVVLLFCVLAGSPAFAKPKAKDYPLQFTVLAGMDTSDGCYMNVTDGDGSIYEIHADHKLFGLDCPVWSRREGAGSLQALAWGGDEPRFLLLCAAEEQAE